MGPDAHGDVLRASPQSELGVKAVDVSEEDELYRESPIAAAERVWRFTTIKELLTAAELGTS